MQVKEATNLYRNIRIASVLLVVWHPDPGSFENPNFAQNCHILYHMSGILFTASFLIRQSTTSLYL
jgi:hypothetical protein